MSSWAIACYSLFCLTLLNFLFLAHFLRTLDGLPPTPATYSYIGDDFPTELPVPLAAVGLVITDGAPHFGITADAEWGTAFPATEGFTALGPANRTFQIAMVHQMHCLDVLRVSFAMRATAAGERYTHHVEHCLRYLRQAVLCHADRTLEPSTPALNAQGEWTHTASGVGTVHRCRDWTALRRYLEEHPPGTAEPQGL